MKKGGFTAGLCETFHSLSYYLEDLIENLLSPIIPLNPSAGFSVPLNSSAMTLCSLPGDEHP